MTRMCLLLLACVGAGAADIILPLNPTHPPYANVEIDLRDPQGKFWPALLIARAEAGGQVQWQDTGTSLAFSAKVVEWGQLSLKQDRRIAGELITYRPNAKNPDDPIPAAPTFTCALRSTGPATKDGDRLKLPVELTIDLASKHAVVNGNAMLRLDRALPRMKLPLTVPKPKQENIEQLADEEVKPQQVPRVALELFVEVPADQLGITRVPTVRVEIRTTAWQFEWPSEKAKGPVVSSDLE
ncbi:hypothetical protein LBMAG53_07880 [Planctomycetota bacterium]|nr:hypothetical protein LBMAG53_07880 [Planctomycetota bacterium]